MFFQVLVSLFSKTCPTGLKRREALCRRDAPNNLRCGPYFILELESSLLRMLREWTCFIVLTIQLVANYIVRRVDGNGHSADAVLHEWCCIKDSDPSSAAHGVI
jgi:hypothetical protein